MTVAKQLNVLHPETRVTIWGPDQRKIIDGIPVKSLLYTEVEPIRDRLISPHGVYAGESNTLHIRII